MNRTRSKRSRKQSGAQHAKQHKTDEITSILDLPDEILEQLLGCLDLQSLLIALQVNKRLYGLRSNRLFAQVASTLVGQSITYDDIISTKDALNWCHALLHYHTRNEAQVRQSLSALLSTQSGLSVQDLQDRIMQVNRQLDCVREQARLNSVLDCLTSLRPLLYYKSIELHQHELQLEEHFVYMMSQLLLFSNVVGYEYLFAFSIDCKCGDGQGNYQLGGNVGIIPVRDIRPGVVNLYEMDLNSLWSYSSETGDVSVQAPEEILLDARMDAQFEQFNSIVMAGVFQSFHPNMPGLLYYDAVLIDNLEESDDELLEGTQPDIPKCLRDSMDLNAQAMLDSWRCRLRNA
eukprot:TRINITY_DN14143_c0_g1_i1.p1 TRINITY_DN14143_c0_g1~~TRINITY_DN14143_c0_g1_i1.p1  ORF type:complete len:347 (-),score=42.53 TRINITY_DN14143_c0_g1_i1:26-1066(-)